MNRFIIVRPRTLHALKVGALTALLAGASFLWLQRELAEPTASAELGNTASFSAVNDSASASASGSSAAKPASAAPTKTVERKIQLVTGEFKSTGPDGKTLEAYRWDPGTVVVNKGELVKLSIYGVNGASHPFIIEGLNVKGEVKKGKETVVTFQPQEAGIYRLICLTHQDIAQNGPMIGYIVVQD
ncbi:cupredoxin domain-containing protein [Paenibacillus sp. YYML68]|uniref:cupredoxin domain-containing protein n=1 Tax=Paenibacillus sp. YYML68 TaxID=2909250 RepID=UPI002490D366|nr:cupredoxin domain-containing protein [Paenibacillus sp. YYML68]